MGYPIWRGGLTILAAVAGARTAAAQVVGGGGQAFTGVNVVDVVAGRVLANRVVVVEGGRIIRIAPADSIALDSSLTVVEGRGGFLMPGLADLHVHIRRPEEFDRYLAAGVTTVQFLNAFEDGLVWREDIARGTRRGPVIESCLGPVSDVPDSAAAEAVLDEAATAGFHCIKIYGGMQGPSYRALVDGGRRRGIRTVGHIPRELGWRDMLTARPDAVAHAEEFLYSPIESQADIDSIVAGMTRQGIGLVTTLTNYDLIGRQLVELPHLLRDADLATYSPVHRRTWEAGRNRYLRIFRPEQLMTLRRLLGFQRALVRQLDSAGTRLLLGTDTGNNFVLPGRSVHDELEQLVLAGLRPAAALRAATVNPAAFLGQTGQWGVVAEGARADLVLLGGNPLTDISNTRLVLGVMNRGTWYVSSSLTCAARVSAATVNIPSVTCVARAISAPSPMPGKM
jgi:hypothetical protein